MSCDFYFFSVQQFLLLKTPGTSVCNVFRGYLRFCFVLLWCSVLLSCASFLFFFLVLRGVDSSFLFFFLVLQGVVSFFLDFLLFCKGLFLFSWILSASSSFSFFCLCPLLSCFPVFFFSSVLSGDLVFNKRDSVTSS